MRVGHAFQLCQPAGLLQRGIVDRLKDLTVQLLRLRAVKWHAQQYECISQALQPAANRQNTIITVDEKWCSSGASSLPIRV